VAGADLDALLPPVLLESFSCAIVDTEVDMSKYYPSGFTVY
jgi:hypothetical protein